MSLAEQEKTQRKGFAERLPRVIERKYPVGKKVREVALGLLQPNSDGTDFRFKSFFCVSSVVSVNFIEPSP